MSGKVLLKMLLQGCNCRSIQLSFSINEDVDGPLYVYYQLENFYQNHRRYVSSVSPYQLNGEVSSVETRTVRFD